MVQSENRPYLKDTSKLHIIYYIAKGTVDERVEKLVLPRVETMARIIGEKDSAAISEVLAQEEESFADMWKRLFSGGPDDDGRADFSDVVGDGIDVGGEE
jgi:hypothetical protein